MNTICANCVNLSSNFSYGGTSSDSTRRSGKFSSRICRTMRRGDFVVAAAATKNSAVSPTRSLARRGEENKKSSALEQLDIERGVCIPFRKYSPETVLLL